MHASSLHHRFCLHHFKGIWITPATPPGTSGSTASTGSAPPAAGCCSACGGPSSPYCRCVRALLPRPVRHDANYPAITSTSPFLQATFAWCTVCFGLAYSNLSYRTVVTTGPYYFCRHPAYIVKVPTSLFDSAFLYSQLRASQLVVDSVVRDDLGAVGRPPWRRGRGPSPT